MGKRKVSLSGLPDEYVECRADGHDWDKIPYDGSLNPKKWRPSNSLVVRQKRCVRCKANKFEYWNAITGEIIIKPVIKYPRDYVTISGAERRLFRKEFLQRNLDEVKVTKLRSVK